MTVTGTLVPIVPEMGEINLALLRRTELPARKLLTVV